MKTLKIRQEFLRVKKTKIFCASRSLILTKAEREEGAECRGRKIDQDEVRVGYVVTKKIVRKKGKRRRKLGKSAVVRNRVKRRLRAAAREILTTAPPADYVIIGREQAIFGSFDDMKRDLKYCLRKIDKNN